MTASSARWMSLIAQLPCCVCVRHSEGGGRIELHHVAEGSGLRNEYAIVALCESHHRGPAGLHGMGSKAFIRLYRPPGDSEWGLTAWRDEDLERLLWQTGRKVA